ncbi:MAG: Holliday junction branch migration protein RuvA [Desulfovibrionaceae bacterium]|nr:Holliday junction branch migration protein RuvA [Desulfovibrionaceae bacterium]
MIAYIEGRIAQQWGNTCLVITAGGVGYAVALPAHTLSRLPEADSIVHFFTAFVVREDAQELYGFETWDERQTFTVLTTISKVGARTALGILSIFRPDDLRQMVASDSEDDLMRVSGIGKKTAQHIFLELKYKLKVEACPQAAALTGSVPGLLFKDALAALGNLGYSEAEAAPIVRTILHAEPDLDVSGLLRAALKQLGKGK